MYTHDIATVFSSRLFLIPILATHPSIILMVSPEAPVGSVYSCRVDPCLPLPRDASSGLVIVSTGAIVTRVDHAGVHVGAGVVVFVGIQAISRAQYVVGILGLPRTVA
jgi:hypothetical protein